MVLLSYQQFFLNSLVHIGASSSTHCFNINGETESGPGAFMYFNFLNTFLIFYYSNYYGIIKHLKLCPDGLMISTVVLVVKPKGKKNPQQKKRYLSHGSSAYPDCIHLLSLSLPCKSGVTRPKQGFNLFLYFSLRLFISLSSFAASRYSK